MILEVNYSHTDKHKQEWTFIMQQLFSKIYDLCSLDFKNIVAIRRQIHMYPELGFDVYKTASIIEAELKKLNTTIKSGLGKTGIVADFKSSFSKRCIAIRAEMDALPIQELGNAHYKSKIEGKSHMCGHDVHIAILIGVARILNELKGELKMNVRLIFQPSEEQFPGGAPAMINDGALNDVDEIYSLHVLPSIEVGYFAIGEGAFLSQPDSFEIEITGKGGHAAMPHLTNNPILIGSHLITALQSIIPNNIDPFETAVISITKFHGGTSFNVIPSSIKISGTVRTFKRELQVKIQDEIEKYTSQITSAYEASYTLNYQQGYPVTYNHKTCVEKVLSISRELVGTQNVSFPYKPLLYGDDFGYYSQKIPACLFLLGAGNKEKGIVNMPHSPYFDVDESCIIYGMAFFVSLALYCYP